MTMMMLKRLALMAFPIVLTSNQGPIDRAVDPTTHAASAEAIVAKAVVLEICGYCTEYQLIVCTTAFGWTEGCHKFTADNPGGPVGRGTDEHPIEDQEEGVGVGRDGCPETHGECNANLHLIEPIEVSVQAGDFTALPDLVRQAKGAYSLDRSKGVLKLLGNCGFLDGVILAKYQLPREAVQLLVDPPARPLASVSIWS